MTTTTATPGARVGRPAGFTLLEVLVSMGVIIAALAGIAALLPAAGSRLGEATDIDRAGTMAANARADLVNRGLASSRLWTVPKLAIVFGEGLAGLSATAPASTTIGDASAVEVAARIDPTSGFLLRDNLQTTAVGGASGFEPGICYGCMLSSSSVPSGPGAAVRLSTVVFRKPAPEMKAFTLTQQGGSQVFLCGTGADAANDRRRFLAGCAWILVVGSGEPRWFQIASSWTTYVPGTTSGAATGQSYVALADTDSLRLVSGGTLRVFGFEGLLRVDERFVNLE